MQLRRRLALIHSICEAGFFVRVKKLSVYQFRNHPWLQLHFQSRFVGFGGANGAGKTNLLDALYVLATGKSYFNVQDKQLIQYGADAYAVGGVLDIPEYEETAVDIRCTFQEGRKQLKWNQKVYDRLIDHYGKIPVTLIAPQDGQLITGGSQERRRFVDGLISQYDAQYLQHLVRYNRALQQRNALLKAERRLTPRETAEWLAPYDAQLADHGRVLLEARHRFLDMFNEQFLDNYRALGAAHERVRMAYEASVADPNLLENRLEEGRTEDLRLRRTTVGPHRDDWSFLLQDHPVRKYGSQGQQKTFLWALKLARHRTLSQCSRTNQPILMLDDFFDRLDSHRMSRLMEWLRHIEAGQIFFTDTDPERLAALGISHGLDMETWVITHDDAQPLTSA